MPFNRTEPCADDSTRQETFDPTRALKSLTDGIASLRVEATEQGMDIAIDGGDGSQWGAGYDTGTLVLEYEKGPMDKDGNALTPTSSLA